MDYDELVQKDTAKEISDLEFLLAQKELALEYRQEMEARNLEINNESARQWLLDYEIRNLYEELWMQQVIKHCNVLPS